MEELLNQIRNKYPFVEVDAYETPNHIELMKIWIPPDQRNGGIGTEIIRIFQAYASTVKKPIVLRPSPERGKKQALDRFYKGLDFVNNKGRNIDYTLSSPTAKTMYWRFKEWIQITEAIFDPKLTNPVVNKNQGSKPYLNRNFSLTLDNKGNVIEYDYQQEKPHLTLTADKRIQLQKLGPQSKEFRQIINALRSKYPDIDQYPVEHYFQAGHMQGANNRYRTVGYWLGRPEIRLSNKLPRYFYHGTSTNLWYEGIKERGLYPRRISGSSGSYGAQNISALSQDDLVYLSTDPDAATREAARQATRKYGGNPLIIRINTNGLDPNKLTPDEDTRANTAQGSVDVASTLGYKGRVPSENLEPFLIGKTDPNGNQFQVKWEKFKDVPISEHPITTKLKKGEIPYYNDPEFYALLDAGIIGEEKTFDNNGFRQTQTVLLDKDITDEKIRSILKKSGWTQNVKAILNDIDNGYRGSIYQLKSLVIPKESLKENIIQLLLKSEIITVKDYEENKVYFDVTNWNIQPHAIKLAKLMGKMSFNELSSQIKEFTEKYKN